MKKLLIIGAVILSSVVAANAQKAPKFSSESNVLDYGEVKFKGDGVREFVFKNVGDAPLMVTNATGSCGCTVPEWPKDPIRPGGSSSIKIKYATDRVGSFTKTVTITTNEIESTGPDGNPVYKKHTVTIKGNVLPAPENQGAPVKANPGVPKE